MLRRLLLLIVAVGFALPVVQFGTPPGVVHADGGLRVTSVTTYTIDADAGTVRVSADMTFKNTVPDRVEGNVVNSAYFSGFRLPAPAGAVNPVATTANGTSLRIDGRFVPDNVDFFFYDIDFARDLFFGQTAHIIVTYDFTGLAPRSLNPSRINAAYAAFSAFGVGDNGLVTVRVVAPIGFVVDTFGSDVERSLEGDSVVYTATDIAEPDEFELFVSARNDLALIEREVVTEVGNSYRLRSWPNDPEWADFIADLVDRGVAELTSLIGRPWPIDGELEVREAYTPYLYGYAGWFSAADREIEIGEDLDQETVLHELSHAWFNTDWFADRWISEGFAQEYASRSAEALGGSSETPDPIRKTDPARIQLNDWGDPDFVGGADEVETYGYNAAWSIIDQVVEEVGVEAVQLVLATTEARSLAYVGDAPAEPAGFTTDWRSFLDQMQELTGSELIESLISDHAANKLQRDELDDRTQARIEYQSLDADGGEWAPPLGVGRQMANWNFDKAEDLIDEARTVLERRDELVSVSAQVGVSVPDTFETDYEAATHDLATVRDDIADQLDAAMTLLASVDAQAADHGLFDRVGLIGTDLPALLEEGRVALTAGDTDTARAKAKEVDDTLGRADDLGKQRGLWALGAFLLVDAIVFTLVLRSSRRRRRRKAEAARVERDRDRTADRDR